VLRFFYENPYAILTITDLGVWMSREERPLADALQQLSVMGYLEQSHASSAYVLSHDREKRAEMDAFFEYLDANPELTRQVRARLRRGEDDRNG
jgi:hypothetical protein